MKSRIISLLLVAILLCSTFLSVLFIADAAEIDVTVQKEQVLYQWDLTKPQTFWSVAGNSVSPLDVAQGSNAACDFLIDENGAYMVPKVEWVSFMTTGACNNVDLSDAQNTKIVIDYETENSTAVIVKIDMTKGDGDNFQECYFKNKKGRGTIEFNVKDLSDNKFGGKGAVASGYISLQLMTTKGTNAAILWKSARVVKNVTDNVSHNNNNPKQIVKSYNLSTGTDKGTDILSVNDTARPQYSADGITFNTSANWAGFTSTFAAIDVSDTTTRLIADIENPYNCTIVYKLVCDGIATHNSENIVKELPWQSADGTHEIYLNQVFTEEQLKAISNGRIQIQFLIFDTEKTVKIKSLSFVKDVPELPQTNEKFKSYKSVELQLPAGKEPVLPGFVSVTTESGRVADIAVTWAKPDGFNNLIPGFYQFKGVLDEQSLADNRVEYTQGTDAEIFASVTLITTYDRFELPVTNSANWSKTEADQYGNYEFTENGLTITPNSLLGYTNSDYVVKNVNMDVVKGISYSVTAGSGRWAIKVQNLTTGDPQIASPEINFTGEGFYDFSEQNWSGIADLRIALYAVGPNNSVTYHSAVLEEKPVPKQSFTVDTTNNKGWIAGDKKAEISGSDDTLEYNFSEKGLQLTSKGGFCSMNYTVSMVDLDVVKGMLYYVDAPNARWEIKITNMKTDETIQITQGEEAWKGTLGTSLSYFDFSNKNWNGVADLRIQAMVVVSGSDPTCTFKNIQLLSQKPDPMPEIPKEPSKKAYSFDLTSIDGWYIGSKKITNAIDKTDNYEYSFTKQGFKFKSKINEEGVFWSAISKSVTNLDLDTLRYLYYKVSTPSAENWDIKVYNLSQTDENGQPLVTTVSGSWRGLYGSDEGYFALPAEWIGACNIKVELYTFTNNDSTGDILFESLKFATNRPASPDSYDIDFSDYKKFSLSGGAVADASKYSNDSGSYEFSKDGLTMSANRLTGEDGSIVFWSDASIKIKNIDFSKTNALQFDVGLTKGNWTISVTNNKTGEIVNYSNTVKPADQAWSGIELPKKGYFNFVKAAKDLLGADWSGIADITVKFQALYIGNGSNVIFRSCKLTKDPENITTITSYDFDFSDYEGWILEEQGLITQQRGVSDNKVATYNFNDAGLTLKTETQEVNGNNIYYSKLKYSIDNVDFDKLNAITFDVSALDSARWDIAVSCSTADVENNRKTISNGEWNGYQGSAVGTMSFKDMKWSGIGTITVQIIGLDFGMGNEIFVKELSLGTGETSIEVPESEAESLEEIENAVVKCPTLDKIQEMLNDKNRFSTQTEVDGNTNIVIIWIILGGALLVLSGIAVVVIILIKKKKSILKQ